MKMIVLKGILARFFARPQRLPAQTTTSTTLPRECGNDKAMGKDTEWRPQLKDVGRTSSLY